jgi:LysW-gamma-L-alpha-aminoadipyl-6-phosphate/LysW-L-glutamyl-5-phosphate reductase
VRAGVIGAAGYTGGEVLRLLLGHPRVEVVFATSDRWAGRPVASVHPNLRSRTALTFTAHDQATAVDVLFLAAPHGTAMHAIERWSRLAGVVVDLSADFRLRNPDEYERRYRHPHPAPQWLGRFVTGLPELARAELRCATHVAVPGCIATAAILALRPAARLLNGETVVTALIGSSAAGMRPGPSSHHPERSGAMRLFQPAGHRHEAEVAQACGTEVRIGGIAVEAVRGVSAVCQAVAAHPQSEADLWRAYRASYSLEPFVRVVSQHRGVYQLPEPKVVMGSNYCDVGFSVSDDGCRITLLAALDNLVKGSAGNAVQCLNIMAGWDETLGLEFPGLHPV